MSDTVYGKQHKILKILFKQYKKNIKSTKTQLSSKLGISRKEISNICQELYKNGFITYVGVNFDPKLTTKGIDYFSRETTITVEDVIKSIIFPIIVAFITTKITLWLSN